VRRFLSGCGLMQLAEPVIYGGNKKGICEKGGRAAADQAGLRAAVVLSQQIPGGMGRIIIFPKPLQGFPVYSGSCL